MIHTGTWAGPAWPVSCARNLSASRSGTAGSRTTSTSTGTGTFARSHSRSRVGWRCGWRGTFVLQATHKLCQSRQLLCRQLA